MAADLARTKKGVSTWQCMDTPRGIAYVFVLVYARMCACVHACVHTRLHACVCARVCACEVRD